MTAKTLTVVFTDIKGFTERTSKSSRAQMVKVLGKHEALLRPIILQHGGRVIKTIGDAFLLTFESPTNAVLCGVRMQAKLRGYNEGASPDDQINIRISMNTGEVELIGNDVFGETVNLASRVEGITDAGEVYFTESTYLVMKKSEVPTSQVGQFRFKGIPEPITVYRVIQDEHLELYNEVIRSQAVAEPVAADAGEVPEGALSANLLYSIEQQQALSARRRFDPIVGAVATVGLAVLVGLAYLGYDAYRYRGARDDAARLIEQGQTKTALSALGALQESKPADPEVLALLEQAIELDVSAIAQAGRFDEATRRLDEHRARYPDLAVLARLGRATAIAQALYRAERNPRTGQERLEALHEEYPRDVEITLARARHEAAHFNVAHALFLVREAKSLDPGLALDEPWMSAAVERYLDLVYREADETLEFIDTHYYAAVKARLATSIGDPQNKAARRNAFVLLSRHSDLGALDEFRFYTMELFYRTIVERFFREETFRYFETLLAEGVPEEVARELPIELPAARVLNENAPDRARALPIIETLFPQALGG